VAGPPGVGFGGLDAPSGMVKLSNAGVLRLRARGGLSRDKSALRSAQDDAFCGGLEMQKTSVFSDLLLPAKHVNAAGS
jgi:hypothetical protein